MSDTGRDCESARIPSSVFRSRSNVALACCGKIDILHSAISTIPHPDTDVGTGSSSGSSRRFSYHAVQQRLSAVARSAQQPGGGRAARLKTRAPSGYAGHVPAKKWEVRGWPFGSEDLCRQSSIVYSIIGYLTRACQVFLSPIGHWNPVSTRCELSKLKRLPSFSCQRRVKDAALFKPELFVS